MSSSKSHNRKILFKSFATGFALLGACTAIPLFSEGCGGSGGGVDPTTGNQYASTYAYMNVINMSSIPTITGKFKHGDGPVSGHPIPAGSSSCTATVGSLNGNNLGAFMVSDGSTGTVAFTDPKGWDTTGDPKGFVWLVYGPITQLADEFINTDLGSGSKVNLFVSDVSASNKNTYQVILTETSTSTVNQVQPVSGSAGQRTQAEGALDPGKTYTISLTSGGVSFATTQFTTAATGEDTILVTLNDRIGGGTGQTLSVFHLGAQPCTL